MVATRFWHSMLRISDPAATLRFFDILGLTQVERYDDEAGRYTLYFLAVAADPEGGQLELTHNWDERGYEGGRNFGHLCFYVDDIYATCEQFVASGVTINRPPRDGWMAFVKTPDGISVELIQAHREKLPPREPWASMANIGAW